MYDVEMQENETVFELKCKLSVNVGIPIEQIRFVFSGIHLEDNKTLKESSIIDGTTLVFYQQKSAKADLAVERSYILSASRPKKTQDYLATLKLPTKDSQNTSSVKATLSEATNSSVETSFEVIDKSQQATEFLPNAKSTERCDSLKHVTSLNEHDTVEQNIEQIRELVGMGFDQESARLALRASFGDLNGAVEYLMNGIPDEVMEWVKSGKLGDDDDEYGDEFEECEEEEGKEKNKWGEDSILPETLTVESIKTAFSGAGVGAAEDDEERIIFQESKTSKLSLLTQLHNHPMVAQIRNLICHNPHAVAAVLREIQLQQPELAAAILSDPEEFIKIVRGDYEKAAQRRRTDDDLNSLGKHNSQTREQHSHKHGELSSEEQADINHIMLVTGVEDYEALGAYAMCNKNVENTINYIFSS
eukprot:MONOS_6516.1-p1 / transcript=MONOS_6516.1 / gene=MONOS_6516 / organism=Monocercomonoides_exilis_PA203 / gene_product=UV excision repair protein RAD23 homolog / transcript_product=UV excision repair protein RAD23 homolog / location=Mono_scaffold00206:54917-56234(+) / protein_length=418 / sequence_SO=supercontig / SO=protein_coding / is_pseudo=false